MSLRRLLLVYNLLLPAALFFMLPAALLKMRRRGGTWAEFLQRLGFYPQALRERLARADRPVWMHAVSVGEVLVARKLVAEILARDAQAMIVLSTTTTTGYGVATRDAPERLIVIHNPVDFRNCVRRALEAIRPRRLVLVEAEVWPNLVDITRREWGLPVALVNARLSPRSEARYAKVRGVVAPVFAQLDQVFVPEPEDPARWAALGVRPEVIQVVGSVKHDYADVPVDPRVQLFRQLLEGVWGVPLPPILMASSTHDGEEEAIGRIFLEIREKVPGLVYCPVPRHFERAAAVELALKKAGLQPVRRSRLPLDGPVPGGEKVDTVIIDSTGELRAWQALGGVVVIGKSFLAAGGQNPVEAVQLGKPVVFGPHMENFGPLVKQLLAAGGAVEVKEIECLKVALPPLFTDSSLAAGLTSGGKAVLARHAGATARTVAGLGM